MANHHQLRTALMALDTKVMMKNFGEKMISLQRLTPGCARDVRDFVCRKLRYFGAAIASLSAIFVDL